MKLFREEITDLRSGISKLTLLIVLLLSLTAECQVHIKGFCKLNSFPIDSSYTGLLSLNYNEDFYTDLLLYSPSKNKIAIMEGEQGGSFLPYKEFNINIQPSVIQNIFDKNKKVTGYAYVSRKKRKAGILEFNPKGMPHIKSEIKLGSYPENISASDVDNNGLSELLISGKAFDGLSLISTEKNKLKEEKIIKGTVYSSAIFGDIGNDSFIDIIAANVLEPGIDLFYNNGYGKFTKERSIKVRNKIKALKFFDYNLDYYDDIILSYDNKIEIYLGLFNSDFKLGSTVTVKYSPDLLITSDFNRDGKIDIAYADTAKGILSILFSNDRGSFENEIVYSKKENVSCLIPFYSKFINGLALLSKNGEVFSITNLSSLNGENTIAPAVFPESPGYCYARSESVSDISFIDQFDSSIKLLVNNRIGIPESYYSFPLLQEESKLISSRYNNQVIFAAWKKGERLIEMIKPDLNSGKSTRYSIYFDGIIEDVSVPEKGEDFRIYVVGTSNNDIILSSFDENGRRTGNFSIKTGRGVAEVKVVPAKLPLIYFWQSRGDSLILYYSSFNGNNLEKPSARFSIKQRNFDNIITYATGKRREDYILSVINTGKKRQVIISGEKFSFLNSDYSVPGKLDITSEKQLFYGETYFRGFSKLMYYSPSENSIYWIDRLNRSRNLYFNKLTDEIDVSEFFVKNLTMNNYQVVFTNKKNSLTIRQLQ